MKDLWHLICSLAWNIKVFLEKFKFVCCDKSYPFFFVIFLSFRILDSSPIIMIKLNFFLFTLFGLIWSTPIQPPSGITEPGDNCCSKFTRFHESLLKAGASNDQPCIDAHKVQLACCFLIAIVRPSICSSASWFGKIFLCFCLYKVCRKKTY